MECSFKGRSELLRVCVRDFSALDDLAPYFGFQKADAKGPIPVVPGHSLFQSDVSFSVDFESEVQNPARVDDLAPISNGPWLATVAEVTKQEDEVAVVRHVRAITDAELNVPVESIRSHIPLERWNRLEPALRERVGVLCESARIDYEAVLGMLVSGRPIRHLPRHYVRKWSGGFVLLLDVSDGMEPFLADQFWLLSKLRGVCGQTLKVHFLKQGCQDIDHCEIPFESTVLAVSKLKPIELWLNLGEKLKAKGNRLHALVPDRRRDFEGVLPRVWKIVVWDGNRSLTRHSKFKYSERAIKESEVHLQLMLDLLSPATRVDVRMLRIARQLLGPVAGVELESLIWSSSSCWSSYEAIGFNPGRAYEESLSRRRNFEGRLAQLRSRFDELIAVNQADLSMVLAEEALVRVALTGAVSDRQERVRRFGVLLERVVQRFREMEESSASKEEIERTGLANWILGMKSRLAEWMREAGCIQEPLERGVTLAQASLGLESIEIESWMDGRWAKEELTGGGISLRTGGVEDIRQNGDVLRVGGAGTYVCSLPAEQPVVNLDEQDTDARIRVMYGSENREIRFEGGRIIAGDYSVEISRLTDQGGVHAGSLWGLVLPITGGCESFSVSTDSIKMTFERFGVPSWGKDISYDSKGVGLSFRVGEVPFSLRWIPAGFPTSLTPKMTREDTGLSPRGFWIGIAPVTQKQWGSVMSKNRSKFIGDNRPVENVSLADAEMFVNRLSDLLGATVRLPTAEEWKFACAIELVGNRELSEYSWHAGNSDGQTQEVMLKKANEYGLFDVVGNVSEWTRPAEGDQSVSYVLGGGWSLKPGSVTKEREQKTIGGLRSPDLGFRILVDHSTQELQDAITLGVTDRKGGSFWDGLKKLFKSD